MSDPHRRTSIPAGQGGEALRHGLDEGLPESGVLQAQFEALKVELLAALRPEPKEAPPLPLFGELVALWLAWIAPQRVCPENEERLSRHLRELFLEDEVTLVPALIDEHLTRLHLSPSTRNKVRGVGRLAIERARANGQWSSNNPFALVRRHREPRREYEQLTDVELAAVQAKLRVDRRREFRVAVHLGLRPGELFALQKSDVDFSKGSVFVHRSHGRDETKTGTDRLLPLLPAVTQDFYEAIRGSPNELVFPGEGGKRQREDTKITRVIRTAMAAAGVGIIETTFKCRRCGGSETLPGRPSESVCTGCQVLRWPVPKVRPYRWYDLRHHAASAHRRAGADPLAIAIVLGHSLGSTTTERTYTHFTLEDLHRELGKWSLPR